MKVREILDLLRRDGWELVGQKGRHRHFKHPAKPGKVTVAGHPGEDLRAGTQRSILRQASLRRP